MKVLIQKFGGTSLETPDVRVKAAQRIINEEKRLQPCCGSIAMEKRSPICHRYTALPCKGYLPRYLPERN